MSGLQDTNAAKEKADILPLAGQDECILLSASKMEKVLQDWWEDKFRREQKAAKASPGGAAAAGAADYAGPPPVVLIITRDIGMAGPKVSGQ
jgi:hypothetical protein